MPSLNIDHLNHFCDAWMRKAQEIDTIELEGVFDQFFTLWVVFNRLYEESGRILVNKQHPIYQGYSFKGKRRFAPPPDRLSATLGVVAFCGPRALKREIFACRNAHDGITYLVEEINHSRLYLHENYETGDPDIERDKELATKAEFGCIASLLSLIYQARCNLFHGQKSFTETQRQLLTSMSSILIVLINVLRQNLELQ